MNERVKEIFEVISEVMVMPDVQPGYPDANGNTKTTWCNRALHRILLWLDGKAELILEPRGLGWTNANAMVRNAKVNLKKVPDGKSAQLLANEGNLVIAVAHNDKGSGHVALVCYDATEYNELNGARIVTMCV